MPGGARRAAAGAGCGRPRGQNADCGGEGRRRLKGGRNGGRVSRRRRPAQGCGGEMAGGRASSGTLPCRLPHIPARCRPDRGRRRHAREQRPGPAPIA